LIFFLFLSLTLLLFFHSAPSLLVFMSSTLGFFFLTPSIGFLVLATTFGFVLFLTSTLILGFFLTTLFLFGLTSTFLVLSFLLGHLSIVFGHASVVFFVGRYFRSSMIVPVFLLVFVVVRFRRCRNGRLFVLGCPSLVFSLLSSSGLVDSSEFLVGDASSFPTPFVPVTLLIVLALTIGGGRDRARLTGLLRERIERSVMVDVRAFSIRAEISHGALMIQSAILSA
jgi:hypothetical protein